MGGGDALPSLRFSKPLILCTYHEDIVRASLRYDSRDRSFLAPHECGNSVCRYWGNALDLCSRRIEVTVKISSNDCDKPTLLQTWIDDGKASVAPADVVPPPFTVTPPFARLDPKKAQTLRILYTGDSLLKTGIRVLAKCRGSAAETVGR